MIIPDMLGHTIAVHDGRKHIPVFVSNRWLDTSSESLPQPVRSVATLKDDKKGKRR